MPMDFPEFTTHPVSVNESKVFINQSAFLDIHLLELIHFQRNNEENREAIVSLMTGYFKLYFPFDYCFSHVDCGSGNNDENVINKNSIVIDIYYTNKENTVLCTRMSLAKMNNGRWGWHYTDIK